MYKRQERIISTHHDGNMVNVVVAPCSPFSVTEGLMIESASLARKHGLRLHTHLCETIDEQEHCIERFGKGRLNNYLSGGGLAMTFGSHMEFTFPKRKLRYSDRKERE